jgi:hypothetical protein
MLSCCQMFRRCLRMCVYAFRAILLMWLCAGVRVCDAVLLSCACLPMECVCVGLFFIHFHTVAPVSTKFGVMVENLPGKVSDT